MAGWQAFARFVVPGHTMAALAASLADDYFEFELIPAAKLLYLDHYWHSLEYSFTF
jgi:hypothetical protein